MQCPNSMCRFLLPIQTTFQGWEWSESVVRYCCWIPYTQLCHTSRSDSHHTMEGQYSVCLSVCPSVTFHENRASLSSDTAAEFPTLNCAIQVGLTLIILWKVSILYVRPSVSYGTRMEPACHQILLPNSLHSTVPYKSVWLSSYYGRSVFCLSVCLILEQEWRKRVVWNCCGSQFGSHYIVEGQYSVCLCLSVYPSVCWSKLPIRIVLSNFTIKTFESFNGETMHAVKYLYDENTTVKYLLFMHPRFWKEIILSVFMWLQDYPIHA